MEGVPAVGVVHNLLPVLLGDDHLRPLPHLHLCTSKTQLATGLISVPPSGIEHYWQHSLQQLWETVRASACMHGMRAWQTLHNTVLACIVSKTVKNSKTGRMPQVHSAQAA